MSMMSDELHNTDVLEEEQRQYSPSMVDTNAVRQTAQDRKALAAAEAMCSIARRDKQCQPMPMPAICHKLQHEALTNSSQRICARLQAVVQQVQLGPKQVHCMRCIAASTSASHQHATISVLKLGSTSYATGRHLCVHEQAALMSTT